jgi:hypothetical protein
MHDYIPRSNEKFLEWSATLINYAVANKLRFQITDEVLEQIQYLKDAYENAFHKAQEPNRGKVDVLLKNETRQELEKLLRQFVKSYLVYNPQANDEDKIKMGLPLHNKKPSPIPPPNTRPNAHVDLSIIRHVTVIVYEQGKKRHGKPYGIHGWNFRWEILNAPPQSINELRNAEFVTKLQHTLTFDENQRGKIIYFCVRWENNNGEKGPWSEIYSTVIP